MGRKHKPLVDGSEGFLDDLRQAVYDEIHRPIPEIKRGFQPARETAVDRLIEAGKRVVERRHHPEQEPEQ